MRKFKHLQEVKPIPQQIPGSTPVCSEIDDLDDGYYRNKRPSYDEKQKMILEGTSNMINEITTLETKNFYESKLYPTFEKINESVARSGRDLSTLNPEAVMSTRIALTTIFSNRAEFIIGNILQVINSEMRSFNCYNHYSSCDEIRKISPEIFNISFYQAFNDSAECATALYYYANTITTMLYNSIVYSKLNAAYQIPTSQFYKDNDEYMRPITVISFDDINNKIMGYSAIIFDGLMTLLEESAHYSEPGYPGIVLVPNN